MCMCLGIKVWNYNMAIDQLAQACFNTFFYEFSSFSPQVSFEIKSFKESGKFRTSTLPFKGMSEKVKYSPIEACASNAHHLNYGNKCLQKFY